MAQYNPDFSRDAKGQYNPDSGFLSIKGGTNAYLLEDELNELQWIQSGLRANLIRQISKSGCIDINGFDNPTAPGGLKELGNSNLNSFMVNGFNSLLDGNISYIDSFNNNGNVITLPEPPSSNYRYDFAYLQFWIKEINPEIGDKIPKYGGVKNNSINYSIIDNRQNLQTTRRIQLQWEIVTVGDIDYEVYPFGFMDRENNTNMKVKANNSSYSFTQSKHDNTLFVAGTGSTSDKLLFHSIDGYVYAIPLFMVRRLNTAGYNEEHNPNGAVNYVDNTVLSNRPDNKYSNIIYSDQIIDLRHLSPLGQSQYNKLYVTYNALNSSLEQLAEQEQHDISVINSRIDVLFSQDDTKIDDLITKHQTDINNINLEILSNRADLDTEILNTSASISNINARIDNLNDKELQDINSINDSITNLTNNLTSDVSSLNLQIDDLKQDLGNINQKLSNDIIALQDTVNQDVSIQMEEMEVEITDLQNNINAKISQINKDVLVLQSGQTNSYDLINNILMNYTSLESRVSNMSQQLEALGLINPVTSLTSYNIDMNLGKVVFNGGTLQPDNTILSEGSSFPVSYSNVDDYVVALTVLGSPDGKIGDIWVEKADNAFLIKNTGSSGIQSNVIAFKNDNMIVVKGQNTFNGNIDGVIINHPLSSNDFIYVTPLADLYGENGDVYINIAPDNNSFTVYNTGSLGNEFEWFIIDVSQLMNCELISLNLAGLGGSPSIGDYGNNYVVINGIPIMPNPVGGVGNIGIITSFNTFNLCCTGSSIGKIQCLVFKEISSLPPNEELVNPVNGATGVAIDCPISFKFDQEVRLSGINLSSITIKDSTGNTLNNIFATLDSDRQTVNITHDNLNSNTTYIVNVPSGIVKNGNRVNNAVISWNFTTI